MKQFANLFSEQNISKYLRIVLLGVSIWGTIVFLVRSITAIAYPYPLDFVEGLMLEQVKKLILGQTMYPADFLWPPYLPSAYPPVFHIILMPFFYMFGQRYWYGRLLSFLATLGVAYLIGRVVQLQTKNTFASFISALFFFVLPYPLYWAPLLRVDMLALFFSWLSLYAFIQMKGNKGILYTIGLSLLAIFTKQTYVVAMPVTITILLLIKNSYKLAITYLFGVIFGAAFLMSLLILFWGEGVWYNLVVINYQMNHYPLFLFGYAGEFISSSAFLLVALLLFFIFFDRDKKGFILTGSYFLFSTVVALLITKLGSNTNYFLELSAAFSLIVGILLNTVKSNHKLFVLVLLLLIGQVVRNNLWTYYHRQFYKTDMIFQRDYAQLHLQYESNEMLMNILRESTGPILADDITVGLLPLLNKKIYIEPFATKQMSENGLWSDQNLLNDISNKEFPYILVNSYKSYNKSDLSFTDGQQLAEHNINIWWTDTTYEAIVDHYVVLTQIGNVVVFIPML